MQTLSNHANKTKKPNRETAQTYLRSLYETASTDEQRNQLAALYQYFMPSKPAKPANPLQWVASSASTDATCPYIQHAYSNGSVLVATDGHTLHHTPCSLAPGYYHRATLEPITLEHCTFPDWPRVMPQPKELANLQPLDLAACPIVEDTKTRKPTTLYDVGAEGYAFQKHLTDRAAAGLTAAPVQYTIYGGDKLYMTDGTSVAVVMGYRTKTGSR